MTEPDWLFDDPAVSDDEELLRRIPWVPDHVGFDPQTGERFPTIAAFQRRAGEGMSVHLVSVVESNGREACNAYDIERFGTVAFPVRVPREVGAGVIAASAPEDVEPDPVLRAAHAEVRPPTFEHVRQDWSLIRDTIVRSCRWVVAPDRIPARKGESRPDSGPAGTT